MGIASRENRRRKSVYFVAENDTNREIRLPIEKIEGAIAGLNGGDFVAAGAMLLDYFQRIVDGLPRYTIFGP